jgi:rhodanese-related sulfurtransferase
MDRVIEFSINHWPLVFSFVVLAILALNIEIKRASGSALNTRETTLKINNEEARIIDIRESKDFKTGHIVDAINIPLLKLDSRMNELEKYKNKPLIVVCNLGQQAGAAVKKLETAGFEQVFKLSGGMSSWRAESLPVVRG